MRDNIDHDYFKKLLKQRLAELNVRQRERKKETDPIELDQSRVGRLSRLDAMQQRAMTQAAVRLENLERQRIGSALDRMEEGEYGYCVFCGDNIAEGRLRFDPSVPTCIGCAQAAEKS